jgi:hypothetical protein
MSKLDASSNEAVGVVLSFFLELEHDDSTTDNINKVTIIRNNFLFINNLHSSYYLTTNLFQ